MDSRLQATRLGYIVMYVPRKVIPDYNATYNVDYKGHHIITEAAKRLGTPLNEIWISQLWKPYGEYVLFHELREIPHRRSELDPKQAHQKAIRDTPKRWKKDPEFQRMVAEIRKTDAITAKKKRKHEDMTWKWFKSTTVPTLFLEKMGKRLRRFIGWLANQSLL